ncbi:zinc-ribbon domain containing protein [Aliikangiella sp. G2MR2-5]|uniref:zinc-ribbon domain containing protein n=1 Tax=Aliikangiella sp. G2MR2-5 TaxID=2788943 RepID=UPI0018AB430E|nr:zinc-ribbon domain containing protein [Aliikangiella sp. G2MR2-5]
MKIAANKDLWADELKRSYDYYDPKFDFYYDYSYTCRGCGLDEVWTAQQQKHHFEVLKKLRGVSSLCNQCFHKYNALKSRFRYFKEQREKETESSKKNAPYIQEWIDAIQEYKKYTDKYDLGMEHRLIGLTKTTDNNCTKNTRLFELILRNKNRFYKMADGRYQPINREPLDALMVGHEYVIANTMMANILKSLEIINVSFSPVIIFERFNSREITGFERLEVERIDDKRSLLDTSLCGNRLLLYKNETVLVTPELRELIESSEQLFEFKKFDLKQRR